MLQRFGGLGPEFGLKNGEGLGFLEFFIYLKLIMNKYLGKNKIINQRREYKI